VGLSEVRRASGEASSRTINFSSQEGAMVVYAVVLSSRALSKDVGCGRMISLVSGSS
jgi:hypothetical protein